MSVDTKTALEAQANVRWIAKQWPALEALLAGRGGNALTGMPKGGASRVPIDVGVSDLMAEIDWKLGWHYCHVLTDETDDVNAIPATPVGRLELAAERYGHFVTGGREGLDFCDDAHHYREEVRKVVQPAEPPVYIGPCPTADCAGELYVRDGLTSTRCRECETSTTVAAQRAWIGEQMEARLMTQAEIGRALKILDLAVSQRAIEKWVQRGRLVERVPGLYPLADAMDLARGVKYRGSGPVRGRGVR